MTPTKTDSKAPAEATVIPPEFTSIRPAESFPDDPSGPSKGDVTWHTLISHPQTASSDLSAGIAVCPPATGSLREHRHAQSEIYYILDGTGRVSIDGKSYEVERGSVIFIPPDAEHGIVNTGDVEPLRWFYVFPTSSFGDVVYRFSE